MTFRKSFEVYKSKLKFLHRVIEMLPPAKKNFSNTCKLSRKKRCYTKIRKQSKGIDLPKYTCREVYEHNTEKSIWVIIERCVYDLTVFLTLHPGGRSILLEYAGTDASEAFEEVGHSDDAVQWMNDYKIGEIEKPTKAKQNKRKKRKKKT